jgi:hypothetical protein
MKMKTTVLIVALAVVTLIPVLASALAETPAAVLLGCRGNVLVVKTGGQTVPGTFGMSLEPGDEVRTGSDSQAEVHFDNGQWVQIGPNSSTQVHGAKAAVDAAGSSAGEKSFEVVQNFLKLKNSEGTSSVARLRSGDKHGDLRAVSPMQSKIRGAAPSFQWSVSDPSTELRLTVYSDKGVHWQSAVPKGATSMPYPSDAPALEAGVTYSWVLETTDPLVFPPLRSEAAFFEVLSAEDTKELDASLAKIDAGAKPSEATHHLFYASLYFDRGLMEDAILETTKALEIDPRNADLHAILAHLYAETGRTEEAMREYDRLLEKR